MVCVINIVWTIKMQEISLEDRMQTYTKNSELMLSAIPDHPILRCTISTIQITKPFFVNVTIYSIKYILCTTL